MTERSSSGSPLRVPKGVLNGLSKNSGHPLAQQRGHLQEDHPAKPYEAHTYVQTPVCQRVSRREFEESVMLLCRTMDVKNDYSHPNEGVDQQRAVTDQSGPLPHSQQGCDSNHLAPEATLTWVLPSADSQNSYGLSYVEKQREAQKFHSKVQPGDISSLIQPHAPQDRAKLWKAVLKGRLAHRRQCKVASDEASPIRLQNQPIMTKSPNWPFGVTTTSRRNSASRRVQHSPLTTRETQLLLRNPHIRDGNVGYLRTPEGLTRSLPPPHVYGSSPGPEPTGKISHLPARPLTGLKRRNAQRKQPKPPAPQDFTSFHNQCYARFRRGRVARDVNVIYSSPVDLARRKSILPQIQEAADESAAYECTHSLASQDQYTSEVKLDRETLLEKPLHREETDESPWPLSSITQRRISSSTPKKENDSSKQNDIGVRTGKPLQRLSFVIRGPRAGPANASLPSPTSSTSPSTTQTAAPHTGTSTLTSEPQLKPEPGSESEHLTEDGPCCSVMGCTWPGCSRIRGVLKMPVPGAMGRSQPEQNKESAAEEMSGDFQLVGNGFAFVKLN